jgi:hypothetical protein
MTLPPNLPLEKRGGVEYHSAIGTSELLAPPLFSRGRLGGVPLASWRWLSKISQAFFKEI